MRFIDEQPAGVEAWRFIDSIANLLPADPGTEIDVHRPGPDGKVIILYRERAPYAAAFLVRDPMNFTNLFCWRAMGGGGDG